MQAIEIKGVRIGEGRPKTIVPLLGATCEELLASAQRAVEAGADCVEWRADFLANPRDVETLARTARELGAALPQTPLIATLRTMEQGGRLVADASEYERLVSELMEDGPDLVDVELGARDYIVRSLVERAHRRGLRVIVSEHDFERTPPTDRMAQTLLAEAGMGADICKLAVMAQHPSDAMRLMVATARVAQTLDVALLTMAMGSAGAITRLAGESFGSTLTFCALGESSAPGQVGLARATAALDALHAALADESSAEKDVR